MTQFGSCIGRETLCREYKGFSLIGLDIDTINPELLCQYVKNNTRTEFDFTKLINIDIVKIKNPDVPILP